MAQPQIYTDDQARAIVAGLNPPTIEGIKAACRCGQPRARMLLDEWRKSQRPVPLSEKLPSISHKPESETGSESITGRSASEPTLADIIERHKIDLDKWEVKQWRVWTAPMDGATVYMYHATIAKLVPERVERLAEWFTRELATAPARRFHYRTRQNDGDHLLEISVPDAHVGKLCWGEETGWQDHGTADACQMVKDAYLNLYRMAPAGAVGRVLIPLGNDLFNSDTIPTTTTGGTHQDDDGLWQQTFRAGVATAIDVLEEIGAEVQTDVLIIPGNHDWQKCFYLGEVLAAHFRGHARVKIDNRAKPRKYFRYGRNCLGFTHGKHEKAADLPLLMTTEPDSEWKRGMLGEWHLGHRHTQRGDERCGVITRWLPSLAPPDAWHTANGYVGNRRAAKAFLYHHDAGPVAEYTHAL